jgi:hypothetical protein
MKPIGMQNDGDLPGALAAQGEAGASFARQHQQHEGGAGQS